MNYKVIGDNIAYQIAKNKLTQKECAEKLQITEVSMSKYILGQKIPRATLLYRLSKVLRCTMEDLCIGLDKEEEE